MPTAQATEALPFPAKGSLRRHSFARLVRDIGRAKVTGSLYLLSRQTKKVVFFEAGQPVFVRSNVLSECLGQVLSREGLITQEQCEQTLEAIRRTGKKQGELLVEMGILSEGNLRYGLEAQLRAKLFDIFSWDEGRYQFKLAPNDGETHGVRLRLSPEGVILSGILETCSEDRANEGLFSSANKYPYVREDFAAIREALDLLPEELYFAECLDGSRNVLTILRTPTNPPVPTPAGLLYGLLEAGVIELAESAQPARPKPPLPQLDAGRLSDDEIAPRFDAQDVVTEYEDTPLPGELPRVRGLLGDHEDDFMGVDDEPSVLQPARVEVSEELVAAEPESIEETFDEDQIELSEEEVEIVAGLSDRAFDVDLRGETPTADGWFDDASLDPFEGGDQGRGEDRGVDDGGYHRNYGGAPFASELDIRALIETYPTRALIGLDELDQVDLQLVDLDPDDVEEHALDPHDVDLSFLEASGETHDPPSLDEQEHSRVGYEGFGDSLASSRESGSGTNAAEMRAAVAFNEGENALRDGQYAEAARRFEEAYRSGFDIAELHAMLAYARFMASDQDALTADHALELLDYAESMDPNQDVIHAYRGAILRQLRKLDEAKQSLRRALEINPFCELALEQMAGLE